jgi:hypothetical protein
VDDPGVALFRIAAGHPKPSLVRYFGILEAVMFPSSYRWLATGSSLASKV